MSAVAADEPKVYAEIFELDVSLVDPDPDQPRLEVDEDLAASIEVHGFLESKPIEVRLHPAEPGRFLIVDGERRWRGAKKAGLRTLYATITTDANVFISAADRLVRQIVHNQGKPLSPVEEALAFKRIVEDRRANGQKAYGPVQLSRDLGIAKSTVTDRLAMTEIPECWLPLIVSGPLQASHVPELHKWRKVPAKYQERALQQMKGDYRWPGVQMGRAKKGERIYVAVLQTLLRTFMLKFIKPVSEVPGYKGPTERGTFESYGAAKTFAMDPSQWQPIYRKQLAARKKARPANRSASGYLAGPSPQQIAANKRARRREAQWEAAEPLIAQRVVEALKGLPVAALAGKGSIAELLIDEIVGGEGRGGMEMDVGDMERTYLARGTTAEDLVRFLALPVLVGDVTHEYGRKDTVRRLKAAGLKIDLEKLVDGIDVTEEDNDEEEADAESGDEAPE